MIMMLQSMSMIMPIEDQTCDGPVVKTSRAKRASSAKAKKRIVRNVDPPKFSEQRGFAIGSAVLVSLALFGAYVSRATISTVDVLTPKVFIGLLVGAMLPYWFSAMTVKSVGSAALKMVEEVRRKFNTIPGLMEGLAKPDYATCVKISTDASIKEMIPPGAPLAVLKF